MNRVEIEDARADAIAKAAALKAKLQTDLTDGQRYLVAAKLKEVRKTIRSLTSLLGDTI